MALDLSIACWTRDLTRSLLTGAVEPDGVDATVIAEYPPRRHRRFFERGDFDVCEVSLASYLSSRERPEEYPFTAIPVFPCKKFPQSFCYRRTDAGIDDPSDLAGERVGVQSWQTTRDVWMRGIARERYGLDLSEVTWYRRKEDDVPVSIPDRFDIRTVPGEQGGEAMVDPDDLRAMFFDGDLVAAMEPANAMFHSVVESDDAALMFDDPVETEREYYRDTGIHPIMHTVAVRDELLEDHPWLAVSLFDAFCEARDDALEANLSPSTHTTNTWAHLHLVEQDRILGEDAWEYGLTDRTVPELEKFQAYADHQGLIPDPYDLDELFVDCSVART